MHQRLEPSAGPGRASRAAHPARGASWVLPPTDAHSTQALHPSPSAADPDWRLGSGPPAATPDPGLQILGRRLSVAGGATVAVAALLPYFAFTGFSRYAGTSWPSSFRLLQLVTGVALLGLGLSMRGRRPAIAFAVAGLFVASLAVRVVAFFTLLGLQGIPSDDYPGMEITYLPHVGAAATLAGSAAVQAGAVLVLVAAAGRHARP